MEASEMFLISWAVVATTFGVWAHSRAKHHFMSHVVVAGLLAEVVVGDVIPTKNNDGSWTVENDDIRLSFKKQK